MARISSYPIISTPSANDLLIGTDVDNLNITKNFTVSGIGAAIGSLFIPYVGATGNVDLGLYGVTGSGFIVNGGLSTQFLKADGSLDVTSYVPDTRILTINGTSYDLSADRSWTVSGLNSLTTTGTGGAATYLSNVLNIPIYQSQGNYITDLSGEATASGPGNASVVLSNSAVIGKVLTGLVVSGGSIVSTDNILQAFGKIQNQINGISGGLDYQGTWNASTNTPTLQSSIGVNGEYYIVDVAGSTNLNGITDWNIGDWVIFNGASWQKIDNSDSVSSVFGRSGAVVAQSGDYTTTLVTEGTNLYFTNTRARSAISSSATGLTYTTATGVFTITAGYSIPTTASQASWNSAYNDSIISAAVTGTTTKTLTLNQQDGGTITASWSDLNTDAVTSVFGRTGAIVAQSGDYTTTLVTEGTNLYFTNTRARSAVSLTTTGSSGAATYDSGTGVFNIPNYTLSGLGGVPSTRTLTINGLTQDLSLDRSWSVGTVTSVGLTMPAAFTVSNSPITGSGTIAVVAAGTASQYIRGDGFLADFPTNIGGGGSSVSYYLNGSINQGVIGGVDYRQFSRTAVLGAGTDFSIATDGYIAQFLTDVNVPDALIIPSGNWNLEFYFSASSSGGTPSFYVELYKYDGVNFTLISDNSATPELIAFGTIISPYFFSLAVPETILTTTDRLAIRVYVLHSGRTVTLHTENSHLCQVITTFTTGLTALNGLTEQVQYFQVGTTGTDFNIDSLIDTHTFNLPTASAINRGALSTSDWSTFNAKQDAITLTTTGNSGASTFISNTLNVPNYTLSGLGGVPSTRSLTINGTAFDLSADRSWSVGTVTSVNMSVPTGFVIGGNPVTASGTLALSFAAGYSLPTNATQATWTTAYNDSIISAAVTGTTTKTLTLNQQDGGTITASWSDLNTDAVTSVFGRTGAVVAQSGDYTTTLVTEGTNLYFTNTRARSAISLTTTGSSGAATYDNVAGIFNIPNYTLSGLGGVPTTRTLTINGTAFDLSADRSWSVGTVTSVDMSVPTGFAISGNPVTSTGTLALSFAAGYSLPSDATQATWTTAYNDSIVSASVTGTTTKTLTLTQQDAGTITASWTDETGSNIFIAGTGTCSSIRDGVNNVASASCSAALSGRSNTVSGYDSVVVGGSGNSIFNNIYSSFIGGGNTNRINAPTSFIGGGSANNVYGYYGFSAIAGGNSNCIGAETRGRDFIGGGSLNFAGGTSSLFGYNNVTAGGEMNCAVGSKAAVVGGRGNIAKGCAPFIGGGCYNYVYSFNPSVVVGGYRNKVYSDNSGIVSGTYNNILTSSFTSFIGGGHCNNISTCFSSIVGGSCNNVSGHSSFIGGGVSNSSFQGCSVVVGGSLNSACGGGSIVGGGVNNQACQSCSVVVGGSLNKAWEVGSFIGGGVNNQACQSCSVVVGGSLNKAYGGGSIVGGGYCNRTLSKYSSILGGKLNQSGNVAYTYPIYGVNNIGSAPPYTSYVTKAQFTLSSGKIGGGPSGDYFGYVSYISPNRQTWCFSGDVTAAFTGPSAVTSAYLYFSSFWNLGGPFNTIPNAYCITAASYSGGYSCVSFLPAFNSPAVIRPETKYATVVSGRSNVADCSYSTIVGGCFNRACGSYSTIIGGRCNYAKGSCSTIGGGASNTTRGAYSNAGGGCFNLTDYCAKGTAIGGGFYNRAFFPWSTISGGSQNSIGLNGTTSYHGAVGGGYCNRVLGNCGAVSGGFCNTACSNAFVGGGTFNTASGDFSSIQGGCRAVANKHGQRSFASGFFAANGDAQQVEFVARNKTTNGTPVTLFLNGSSVRLTIASGTAMFLTVNVGGIRSDGGAAAHYIRKVAIKNVGGTTSLIGTVSAIGTDVEDNAAYDVTITADNTNDALQINVTGVAAQTLRWVSHIEGIEITYGT